MLPSYPLQQVLIHMSYTAKTYQILQIRNPVFVKSCYHFLNDKIYPQLSFKEDISFYHMSSSVKRSYCINSICSENRPIKIQLTYPIELIFGQDHCHLTSYSTFHKNQISYLGGKMHFRLKFHIGSSGTKLR